MGAAGASGNGTKVDASGEDLWGIKKENPMGAAGVSGKGTTAARVPDAEDPRAAAPATVAGLSHVLERAPRVYVSPAAPTTCIKSKALPESVN